MKYEPVPFFTRKLVLERDNYTCQSCKIQLPGTKLDIHHKIPTRKGGTHDHKNLVTLCKKCHKVIEPTNSLNYAYSVSDPTLRIDVKTYSKLGILANIESRSRINELRFLIKERLKELGVKLK
jgi:hypothetical protein